MHDETERAARLQQLKWSLQALAVSPSEQMALFPDAVAHADELALDFDHACSVIATGDEIGLSKDAAEALAAIGRKLEVMSRHGSEYDAAIWTDAALFSDSHWTDIRRLASAALEALGWPLESPPRDAVDRGTTFVL